MKPKSEIRYIPYFLLLLFLSLIFALELKDKNCGIKTTCSECIQTYGCLWCKDNNNVFTINSKRCFDSNDTEIQSICKEREDPKGSFHQVSFDKDGNRSLAFSPYSYSLRLRPGEKLTIPMNYTNQQNRPLDLYILMDSSETMYRHKQNVANLAKNLFTNLRNLTSDLKLGFGSFIDKSIGPFSSLKSKDFNLFKHHLSMTHDEGKFSETVNNLNLSNNVDNPEGGLDALMQVISCTNSSNGIGWRSMANRIRKMVVVITDGPFHIAGDGRLGGIIRPYDGLCHLDKNGEYSKELVLDYPSIAQVKDMIERQNMFVVFVVTNKIIHPIYEKLVSRIGSASASVQKIGTADSKNSIIAVIKTEYEKIVNQVILKDVSNEDLDVVYFVKCPESNVFQKGNGCTGLSPDATIEFKVEVTLKQCPKKTRSTLIEISPYDSLGESTVFRLDLEKLLCNCNCEEGNPTVSKLCGEKGSLQCGICKCQRDWGGPKCNCSLGGGGQSMNHSLCKDDQNRICSNRGACLCGTCECQKGFKGGLCQSQICSEGFTGPQCECDGTKCRNPLSKKEDELCSGVKFGECSCDKCKCSRGYHGVHCELQYSKFETLDCNKTVLKVTGDCVKCLYNENSDVKDKSTILNNVCKSACQYSDMEINDKENQMDLQVDECPGSVETLKGCDLNYIVGSSNVLTNRIKVRIEQDPKLQNCPPISNWIIIAIVCGFILLIGFVILLIWKGFVHIHDQKEFAKFKNETDCVTWNSNQNPLYQATISEFTNPVYSTEEIEDPKNK